MCIILLSVTRNECVANGCVRIWKMLQHLHTTHDDDDDDDMTQKGLEVIVNYYYHEEIHDA